MPGGSVDFYSVAAQVVPVLVLVVLLEQREHRKMIGPLPDFIVVLSAVLAAALAEIVSLHEVYRKASAATDQYWVTIPMAYLALVIVAPVLSTQIRAVEARGSRVGTTAAWAAPLVVGWFLLVAGFAATR